MRAEQHRCICLACLVTWSRVSRCSKYDFAMLFFVSDHGGHQDPHNRPVPNSKRSIKCDNPRYIMLHAEGVPSVFFFYYDSVPIHWHRMPRLVCCVAALIMKT
jgi:hypothetical protein